MKDERKTRRKLKKRIKFVKKYSKEIHKNDEDIKPTKKQVEKVFNL